MSRATSVLSLLLFPLARTSHCSVMIITDAFHPLRYLDAQESV
jgi:hypothetical protein